jgi:hypothetical protein
MEVIKQREVKMENLIPKFDCTEPILHVHSYKFTSSFGNVKTAPIS